MSELHPEVVLIISKIRTAASSLEDVQATLTLLLGSRSHMEEPEYAQVLKANSKLALVRGQLEAAMVNTGTAREVAILDGAR